MISAAFAHLTSVVVHATGLRTRQTGPSRTLTGSTPLRDLAADPAIGPLHRTCADRQPAGLVRFTLVIDAHDLPVTLKTGVPATDNPGGIRQQPFDPFSVTYRDWARGDPITARPGPSPSPQ